MEKWQKKREGEERRKGEKRRKSGHTKPPVAPVALLETVSANTPRPPRRRRLPSFVPRRTRFVIFKAERRQDRPFLLEEMTRSSRRDASPWLFYFSPTYSSLRSLSRIILPALLPPNFRVLLFIVSDGCCVIYEKMD